MHEILYKLKILTVQFLVKFLLENWSRVKILDKLTFFSSKILYKLKIRREIEFEAKMIRILSLYKISCIFHHVKKSSFDDFLSLYKIPPVSEFSINYRWNFRYNSVKSDINCGRALVAWTAKYLIGEAFIYFWLQ